MMTEVPQCVEVSYKDAQCLMQIAMAEAEDQGVDGMGLVMQVVYNRVTSDFFPDTIEEVIEQDGQFESYSNGRYDSMTDFSVDCHLALAEFEKGVYIGQPIIGFEIKDNRTLDKYYDYAFTYRGHDFYTWRYEE